MDTPTYWDIVQLHQNGIITQTEARAILYEGHSSFSSVLKEDLSSEESHQALPQPQGLTACETHLPLSPLFQTQETPIEDRVDSFNSILSTPGEAQQ